jgi:SOS response regulatory protein OraA/RecX
VVGAVSCNEEERYMTEQTLRRKLRKEGYSLHKRAEGYMVVYVEYNCVVVGGEVNGFSLSFDEVVDFLEEK